MCISYFLLFYFFHYFRARANTNFECLEEKQFFVLFLNKLTVDDVDDDDDDDDDDAIIRVYVLSNVCLKLLA
jgi:hypothetical protein